MYTLNLTLIFTNPDSNTPSIFEKKLDLGQPLIDTIKHSGYLFVLQDASSQEDPVTQNAICRVEEEVSFVQVKHLIGHHKWTVPIQWKLNQFSISDF